MTKRFDVPCQIAIEQSEDHFHAHVELEGDVKLGPGDRVRVHGDPVQVEFGDRICVSRMATVTRAGAAERVWTRFAAYFDFKELYEVSFNPGRVR